MGQDVDAARDAFATVPPARPARPHETADPAADPSAEVSGPHAPGSASPAAQTVPETGGYDTRPAPPGPDNRRGGHGAG